MRSFYKPLVFQLLVEGYVAFVAGTGNLSVFHCLDYFAALLAQVGAFCVSAGGEQGLEFSEAGDKRVPYEFGDLGRLKDAKSGGVGYEGAVKSRGFTEGIEGNRSCGVLSSLYLARFSRLEGELLEHGVHE